MLPLRKVSNYWRVVFFFFKQFFLSTSRGFGPPPALQFFFCVGHQHQPLWNVALRLFPVHHIAEFRISWREENGTKFIIYPVIVPEKMNLVIHDYFRFRFYDFSIFWGFTIMQILLSSPVFWWTFGMLLIGIPKLGIIIRTVSVPLVDH